MSSRNRETSTAIPVMPVLDALVPRAKASECRYARQLAQARRQWKKHSSTGYPGAEITRLKYANPSNMVPTVVWSRYSVARARQFQCETATNSNISVRF
eukprot:m.18319 g.18319  ORF g.18319 m.18319 type:complete len:99 (-) comp5300_c0_seq1:81-377(-)